MLNVVRVRVANCADLLLTENKQNCFKVEIMNSVFYTDILSWLKNNTIGCCVYYPQGGRLNSDIRVMRPIVYFEKPEDAVHFKFVWC